MDLSAFDLKGKVALITGGAHGIGFSIAEGMAKCGATVCFNCSNEGSLEKGLAAYKAAGIDAHGYVADVTDEAAVNAMIAQSKADVSLWITDRFIGKTTTNARITYKGQPAVVRGGAKFMGGEISHVE